MTLYRGEVRRLAVNGMVLGSGWLILAADQVYAAGSDVSHTDSDLAHLSSTVRLNCWE
jgi:hypothetical protein